MHVHSSRSDGLRSPLELAQLARRSGLSGLALTDHDICPSPGTVADVTRCTGMELIVGVEISTELDTRPFHLLGYGFAAGVVPLDSICHRLGSARKERFWWMVQQLSVRGVRLDPARTRRIGASPRPCRLQLARELVRAGHCTSLRAAFARHLSELDAAGPQDMRLPMAQAVRHLHEAGGVAVLAHPPVGLDTEQWDALIATGIDGIETRFGRVSNCHRRFLEARAEKNGLACSAGSDYHGDENGNYLGRHTLDRPALEQLLDPSKVSTGLNR